MESSSSPAGASSSMLIRKLNDAVYELYRPERGPVESEIVFFHGFQSDEPHWQTWMRADNSASWLNTWLAQEFPQSRIISVAYDSGIDVSDSEEPMDMYLIAENLTQSIIRLAEVGQRCPVIFVGHSVGGLVLKEICLRADRMASLEEHSGLNPYKTFLRNMRGAFFFSTASAGGGSYPALGARWKQRIPLLKYEDLFSKETARLTSDFAMLRHKHGWRTFGVSGANETYTMIRVSTLIRQFFLRTASSEASFRQDLDGFSVLTGEDNLTICKPKDRNSSNFVLLVDFVREIFEIEDTAKEKWRDSIQFPAVFVSMVARVKWVINELQLGKDDPSQVLLVGMSGIGKSTLAKEVFMKIAPQFEFTCFLENLTGQLNQHKLQTLVANNLYTGTGRKVWLQDGDVQSLWLLLRGKVVLMVLDDVSSEEQIRTLLISDWWGRGSRLIVTSRERSDTLFPTFTKWEVPILPWRRAEELFLAHLDNQVLRTIRMDMIAKAIEKCNGLPLALEVIGSYLRFEKDINVWTGALDRLERAESLFGNQDDKLWAKLRVSFDTLALAERRIFLDLAVFDKSDPHKQQYNLPVWKAVWRSRRDSLSVDACLKNLVDRSFIRIKNEKGYESTGIANSLRTVIWIHQQLQDMGKSISRPFNERIELCRGVWQQNDVEELLTKCKREDAHTEVLSVAADQITAHSAQFRWTSVSQLQELRLLRLSNVRLGLVGNIVQRFPPSILFLHMISCNRGPVRSRPRFLDNDCCPLREEDVEGLHLLRVLILEDCNPVRLPNNFHMLSNLKVLIIRGEHFKRFPKAFGLLHSLEHLCLENVGVSKLPDSLWDLPSLTSLKLSGCSALKTWTLPNSGIALLGEASSTPLCTLETLILEDLHGLTELPELFGLIRSLKNMSIIRCSALRKLPKTFERLRDSGILDIIECEGLGFSSETLEDLETLSVLKVGFGRRLFRLPNSLGILKSLNLLTFER